MSLFLGKIHYWLFNKILWFENIEECVITLALEEGIDIKNVRNEIESKYGKKLENRNSTYPVPTNNALFLENPGQ